MVIFIFNTISVNNKNISTSHTTYHPDFVLYVLHLCTHNSRYQWANKRTSPIDINLHNFKLNAVSKCYLQHTN